MYLVRSEWLNKEGMNVYRQKLPNGLDCHIVSVNFFRIATDLIR